jgi:hypothetical protein
MDSFYEELEPLFDKFPKHHMKMLLGDFNANVNRGDIFKQTIANENLYETGNDNRVRVVNSDTSKNLIATNTKFPHRYIHEFTWTSPEGKTNNQTDHILKDRRQHSSVLDLRLFRITDCDI